MLSAERWLAPAKLTLTLRVTGIRADGYHLIDAEMVTLDLADTLDIMALDVPASDVPASDGTASGGTAPDLEDGSGGESIGESAAESMGAVMNESVIELVDGSTGRLDPIPLGADNLVARALRLAGRKAHVRLTKHIPPGAGLGGGSSDAAAILRWAGVTDLDAAAHIGADVPFCMIGGRARVSGIGEVVEPLAVIERTLTLLTPPFGCSTPAVYAAWDRLGGPTAEGPNDLEPAALTVEPGLAAYRDALGEATGQTPHLAGSGSTWFVEGAFAGPGRVVARTTAALGTVGGAHC